MALTKLVLALQTEKARVLGDAGAAGPGQTFVVTFERVGSGIGNGGRVGIGVDEVR